MPQLSQLSDVALSQFFWLAIALGWTLERWPWRLHATYDETIADRGAGDDAVAARVLGRHLLDGDDRRPARRALDFVLRRFDVVVMARYDQDSDALTKQPGDVTALGVDPVDGLHEVAYIGVACLSGTVRLLDRSCTVPWTSRASS